MVEEGIRSSPRKKKKLFCSLLADKCDHNSECGRQRGAAVFCVLLIAVDADVGAECVRTGAFEKACREVVRSCGRCSCALWFGFLVT